MRFLIIIALLAQTYGKHEKYIGWKSYYVRPETEKQMQNFNTIVDKYNLDVLGRPILGHEGVLIVNPKHEAAFIQDIKSSGISHRIHVDDVKSHLDYDDKLIGVQKKASMARHGSHQLPYDNYQELEVIDAYLDYIGEMYPEVATVVTAAKSFQGKPIKYVKISSNNFKNLSKPIIFIDGGMHSREWITPPTVTWAIRKLVENVTENDLLERYDWILLPIINPDGYVHSFKEDRLWRKTRSTNHGGNSSLCPGVDGNRNFDFFWNKIGTSSDPCAHNYAGSTVFSEVETRTVRDLLKEHLSRIALYISLHSFGSIIVHPWSHDGSVPKNAWRLQVLGTAMASAMEKNAISYFPPYAVGNSAQTLRYYLSGSSMDYAYRIGVPLTYTFELPGISYDKNGFHLEPQYIEQVCRDTWEGIVVGAREVGNLFDIKRI